MTTDDAGAAGNTSPGHGWASTQTVTVLLAFLLLLLLSLRQIGSPDAGFHLRIGTSILAGDGWPDRDRFTYTLTDREYVDTSWGYQVLVALTYRAAGAPGLVLLHALALSALFAVVLGTARLLPCGPTTLVLLLALGIVASEDRFEIRPEVFSYLLLAVVLLLLHRRAETGRAPLLALPLLFLVWANLHSFFVLGWAAIGCFLIPGLLPSRRLDTGLAAALVASVLVTLVNPYGWRAAALALSLLTRFRSSSPLRPHVSEFQSPLGDLDSLRGACFVVLLALAGGALLGLVRRGRFTPVLLAALGAALALRMSRNVPLLAVLALPGTAWGLHALLAPVLAAATRSIPRARAAALASTAGTVLVGAAALLLAARVVTGAYYVDGDRNDRFGLGWNRLRLPVDAVDFVRESQLEGRVLNHLAFGGYLMWSLDRPVYIDGRLELAGDEAFLAFLELLRSPQALEAAARRHGASWLIFPYFGQMDLLRRLGANPRWQLAYHDHLSAVFVRSETLPTGSAARLDGAPHHALLGAPPGPQLGLVGPSLPTPFGCLARGFVRRRRFAAEANGDGLFHLARGETALARAFFERTIAGSDGCQAAPYANLASALLLERRLPEALVPLAAARRVADDASLRELESRVRAALR